MPLDDGTCRYVYLRRKKLLIASALTVTNDKSLTFYSLTFYSFTFKDMLLWGRGMGKMPIPPTFYSFTFLLFYFFKVVLSFSFCSSAVLDGSGGAVVIASEAR